MKTSTCSCLMLAALISAQSPAHAEPTDGTTKAVRHLIDRLDDALPSYIYKDIGWPGNLDYFPSGWMGNTKGLTIDTNYKISGSDGTCVKLRLTGEEWAGIYWQHPAGNWGKEAKKQGRDLSGATMLSFRARSIGNPITVEFGIGGIDGISGDSTDKISKRFRLGTDWEYHDIPLAGHDLSHIIGGFMAVFQTPGTIMVDEIRFDMSAPPASSRLMPSFQIRHPSPLHPVLDCSAHTYDNALAMIALAEAARNTGMREDLRKGARSRLKIMAEAVHLAMTSDRYYTDGRLRNVYWGGPEILDSKHHARLNGWFSEKRKRWLEDGYDVSTYTGNMAWMGLAMIEAWTTLQAPDKQGVYLADAIRLTDWIDAHTRATDSLGGFTGGYDGPDPDKEHPNSSSKILWRATEHNLDIVALANHLHDITQDQRWQDMSLHARGFVDKMFNPKEGHYWTGTLPDGNLNKSVIPLDCQTWAALTLGDKPETRRAVAWALKKLSSMGTVNKQKITGYSFGSRHKGIWSEGTAQMALACGVLGMSEEQNRSKLSLGVLQSMHPKGNGMGIVATCEEFQSTGFGENKYFAIPHIGATAWFILAQTGSNPMR